MFNINNMDLSDDGKWRKSKVESFIRRHLNVVNLGMTRYYEMCMWDNKGTLSPSYAILLDNSIVLTENPPKSIVHTIPLAMIQDISLIADRHSLIRGKNNNSYICQHISIVYESSKKKKGRGEGTTGTSPTTKNDRLTSEERIGGSRPSSSLSSNYSRNSNTNWSAEGSDASASPAPSSLNDSFRSSFILSAYQSTIPLINGNHYAWINSLESVKMKENDNDNRRRLSKSERTPTGTPENKLQQRERKKGLMKEVNYDVRNGFIHSSSPELEKWQPHHWKKKGEPHVFSRRPRKDDSLERNVGIHNGNGLGKANEGLTRRKLNRTSETNAIGAAENHKNKKKKGLGLQGQQEELHGKPFEKFEDIHLYFYQRAEFLSEVSLKNTEREEEDGLGLSKSLVLNRSLRAAEKIATRVAQDWHGFGDDDGGNGEGPTVSLSKGRLAPKIRNDGLLRKVGFLHKCLMRYEHLKYLCWKNTVIMSGLINAINKFLEPISPTRDYEHDFSLEEIYVDKVATYAILMDIFRTLFEACSVSWFKDTEYVSSNHRLRSRENLNDLEVDIWDYKLTIFDVTQKLLVGILKCPFLPQSCDSEDYPPQGHNGFVSISDSYDFGKSPWITLDDENSAKMAGLICTAHNASVALLFELLAICHFLPKFIEQALVTCGIQKMNLEHFVRLSVTQIVNILWSSNDPLTASQTMILYRQVWNLRTLVKHDVKILHYIRSNFSEEFRYYVCTKGIKARIPDQYTIKPKVIEACEKLCEDVVNK